VSDIASPPALPSFDSLPTVDGIVPAGVLLPGDDKAAIAAWLGEFIRRPNTLRAYRREARRLWLWLSLERRVRLRDLTRADIEAYRTFLASPPADWMLPIAEAAEADAWWPLRGPLGEAALRQALVILQSLFTYLVDAGYLERNVMRLVRDKGAPPQRPHRPVPSAAAMLGALGWLRDRADQLRADEQRPAARQARRDALIWCWCYIAAARRHELGPTRLSDIQPREGPGGVQWFWQVLGKGERLAYVPLESTAVDTVAWALGCPASQLPARLLASPERYLFDPLRGPARPLSATQVYDSILRSAAAVAQHADAIGLDARDASLLASMGPHDLRAARNTHLLNAGRDARLVQRLMRHKDINTTLVYDHTADAALHAALFPESTASVGASGLSQ
jgi:integrase/recombinase XerC